MTKLKLNELMKDYCIIPSELDNVISFVVDLLYLRRKELIDDESYATRKIDSLYSAEIEVYDLIEYISELEDEE